MIKCEYEDEYSDIHTGEPKEYKCHRGCIQNSKYCEFHDKDYFEKNQNAVKELFCNELTNGREDPKQLFFVGCNIPAIDICHVKLREAVYFSNATFWGNVNFFDVQFEMVDFSNARFCGNLQATHMCVNNRFLFSKTKLEPTATRIEFKMCNFSEGDFSLTDYQSIVFGDCNLRVMNFRSCQFQKNISIKDCSVSDKADFAGCCFLGESTFSMTSFHSNALFQDSVFETRAKFENVDFKEPQLVSFGGNLSHVSFVGTNITRIKFDGNTVWGGEDGYTIFDARELAKNPPKSDLFLVLSTYRDLRENYEFRLMYEEAGQLFIKEMEIKRVYYQDQGDGNTTKIKKWRRYFSLTNCYRILSNYGESFKRVSAWSIVLFVSASVYFFIELHINGSGGLPEDVDYVSTSTTDLLLVLETSLERTFGAFFQVAEGSLPDYVVRMAALPILGAMFVVLRRKLERKFRH